jgi:hypothetical protein
MSHIDKQATIDAIAQKAKDELADVNHYFLEGVQLAVDVVEGMPDLQQILTCDGCRYVGTYDTDFPCSGCIRKEKDYYVPEG